MKYTNKHGQTYTTLYGTVEHDLYADLVAAIHIGRALEAKCERLEQDVRDLVHANLLLQAEINRLELVS